MAIEYVGGRTEAFVGLLSAAPAAITLTGLTGGIASAPAEGDLVLVSHAIAATLDNSASIWAPAIQFVGAKTGSFAGTTSNQTISLSGLTGGAGSAPQEGDMVIVAYGIGSTVNRAMQINTPSGGAAYTLIGSELTASDTFDANLRVAYKFMGATPDTNVEFTGGTGSTSDAGCYAIFVFRGVDQTTPMDVAATTATGISSRVVNPPSITPSTTGALIFTAGTAACGTGGLYTAPQIFQFRAVTQADTNDCNLGAGFVPWIDTSGARDLTTFSGGGTTSTSDSWCALTCALRPAASAQTDYTLVGSEQYANDTFDANLRVAYRIMGSTLETEVNVASSASTSNTVGVTVQVFRGVDPTTPLDVAVQQATGIDTRLADPPSITPATSGAVVVAVGAGAGGTGGTYTHPTLDNFIAATQAGTQDVLIGAGYEFWTSGALNVGAFTGGGTDTTSDSWCATTLALRPASAGNDQIDGTSAGAATTTGDGRAYKRGAGDADGIATVAGDGIATVRAAGLSTGTAEVSGDGVARKPAAGNAAGVATVSGAIQAGVVTESGAGNAPGIASVSGFGRAYARASASAVAGATATADGISRAPMAGIAAGAGTVSGEGSAIGRASGLAEAVAIIDGELRVYARGAGAVSAGASVDGVGFVPGVQSGAGLAEGGATVTGIVRNVGVQVEYPDTQIVYSGDWPAFPRPKKLERTIVRALGISINSATAVGVVQAAHVRKKARGRIAARSKTIGVLAHVARRPKKYRDREVFLNIV